MDGYQSFPPEPLPCFLAHHTLALRYMGIEIRGPFTAALLPCAQVTSRNPYFALLLHTMTGPCAALSRFLLSASECCACHRAPPRVALSTLLPKSACSATCLVCQRGIHPCLSFDLLIRRCPWSRWRPSRAFELDCGAKSSHARLHPCLQACACCVAPAPQLVWQDCPPANLPRESPWTLLAQSTRPQAHKVWGMNQAWQPGN